MKVKPNEFNNHRQSKLSRVSCQDNQYLLNQMYSRAKYKIKQQSNQKSRHSTIYSQSIQVNNIPKKAQSQSQYSTKKQSLSHIHHSGYKNIKIDKNDNKKLYFRTQMDEYQHDNTQNIHLENQMMKNQLIKCRNKIIQLQTYQQQSEYLKKLCLLQNIQIQKLRNMVKTCKMQNAKHLSCKKQVQSSSQYTRSIDYALTQQQQNIPVNSLKKYKKFKCHHKNRQIDREKECRQNRVKLQVSKNNIIHQKRASGINTHCRK